MTLRYWDFGVALAIFALDRVTKAVIEARVTVWDTVVVAPGFFNIVHTQNRGIAFGIMNGSTSPLRTVLLTGVSSVILAMVGWLLWQASSRGWVLRLGLALVLGGALGNLYDRALLGSVTDFLEFYVGSFVWPAFNVADSAICVGAGLLILDIVVHRDETVRT